MSKKITSLTDEQKVRLEEFKKEWLDIGLSCEPANFVEGDKYIAKMYNRIGVKTPVILHFSSPYECEYYANMILDPDFEIGKTKKLKPYFSNNRWGAGHWCSWESFYLFCEEVGVVYEKPNHEMLHDWAALSKNIGWWAPFENICFVSDRPLKINLDEEGRLHSSTGKSIEFRDGFGCYTWHGTDIPKNWIEDKKNIKISDAVTWPNLEQRRILMYDIIGMANVLKELDCKVIDEDGDPQIGTLVEVKLPDLPRPSKFCLVKCGTGREFAIGVPNTIETALGAQAWMQNKPLKKYVVPEVRT